MICCGSCFGDSFISSHIEQLGPHSMGVCQTCGAKNVSLIEPNQLVDVFQQVLDLYINRSDEEGEYLHYFLFKDWGLFQNIDEDKSMEIMGEMVDGGKDKTYHRLCTVDVDSITQWEEFRSELKHNNRFFPEGFPKREKLKELFDFLSSSPDDCPNLLFRARVNIDVDSYSIEQMGKPPEMKASGGRANPIGISYLYTASNILTAISEIRPHKGESISVAKFKVNGDLKFIDLRSPRVKNSPFSLDEEQLNRLHSGMDFLCRLGEELTKPVFPHKAHLEYLPSQYLCEFIKSLGYDGVLYKSSLGEGDNYAIFNDSKLSGISVEVVSVKDVRLEYISGNEESLLGEECSRDNNEKKLGVVKWFDDEKGFGFVKMDGLPDVFVHYKGINGHGRRTLIAGQHVSFEIKESPKGIEALNLTIVQ